MIDKDYTKKNLGNLGEGLAEKHLKQKGFKIIEKNYRCPIGEVDLIAKKDDLLVFVEVKTRTSDEFDPFDSVTVKKQKKLYKLAEYYTKNLKEVPFIRFDVIGISFLGERPEIDHLENAFYL